MMGLIMEHTWELCGDLSGSVADTGMDQPVTSLTVRLDFWDFRKPGGEGLEKWLCEELMF